jgi:hypothetical protein
MGSGFAQIKPTSLSVWNLSKIAHIRRFRALRNQGEVAELSALPMSIADQFWQYAKETMLPACDAETDDDRHPPVRPRASPL